MSSRQEEKERRRREREEREQAEASKVASRRRLQLVAGAVIGLVAIAAVVAAIVSAAGGGGDDKGDGGGSASGSYKSVALPVRKTTDFDAAVKAAGCTYRKYPSEGRTHLPSDTAVNNKYKTNPPTSGNHRPTPAEDGVYAPGNTPDKENFVHTLEHGRIELQYSPKAPAAVRNQLYSLFNEKVKGVSGYHMVLFENNTNMPYEVAVTAWTQLLGCETVNDKTWDAIRAFRDRFVDKGPELIP
ncbi:hypothetical protein DSM104299_00109 [Baekduia alba]|uniref:DUF3105 domain-containing protein n=1 Tax=Baekduia alba TaxID=2997333 RepID=UPI0023412184|nr:DUF3105 domain-containing protein [Baekduia alba]WCB91438.1 hypothetical protein DSM104299_00109 [Baekduia alba]